MLFVACFHIFVCFLFLSSTPLFHQDIERSLFDVPSTFFRAPQAGNVHWMDERIEGYFFDSSIMPLFVQDNYVLAVQGAEGNSIVLAMESLARAVLCLIVIIGQLSFIFVSYIWLLRVMLFPKAPLSRRKLPQRKTTAWHRCIFYEILFEFSRFF